MKRRQTQEEKIAEATGEKIDSWSILVSILCTNIFYEYDKSNRTEITIQFGLITILIMVLSQVIFYFKKLRYTSGDSELRWILFVISGCKLAFTLGIFRLFQISFNIIMEMLSNSGLNVAETVVLFITTVSVALTAVINLNFMESS